MRELKERFAYSSGCCFSISNVTLNCSKQNWSFGYTDSGGRELTTYLILPFLTDTAKTYLKIHNW